MLASDGSVREAVDHIFAPIKNADTEIEPASEDPLDLEVAEFARRLLFDWLDQPWLELLDQVTEYLTFGFYVGEFNEKVVDESLSYTDPTSGDVVDLPPRQFLVLDRIEQRLPSTIFKWNAEAGRLVSIVQHVFVDRDKNSQGFETVPIPAENLLVLTNRKRGDDFTGQSILRPARKPWLLKELIEKIEAVALERWGVGIPVAYPPESARGDDAVLDKLEVILESLRGGEFSYVVMPGPKATGSGPGAADGYVLEILSPSGTPPNFTDAKSYHRAEIKAAVLARFAELGHASVGARATGDIQSVVWFAALHAVARYIEQAFQQVIVRYVDLNYTVKAYPTLSLSGVESRNLAEFAQANAQLVSSGAVLPDRSWRQWTRASMDAPEEDEDAEEQAKENEPPPQADPFAPKPPPGTDPTIEKE
jgi:hypothetical protein